MAWTDLLFPKTCPCCGKPLNKGERVCPDCGRAVRRNESPYCPFCGVSERNCACRKNERPYDHMVAPFFYEGPVREAILRMKFGKKEEGARFLAEELRDAIDARLFGESFDVVAVVPMSRERYAERGFNQARSLAEFVMEDPPEPLKNALPDYGLLRKKNTGGAMQHLLGAEGRRENIRNAVSVGKHRDLKGKRVLLLDDLVTTGATAGECAVLLRMAGAESVSVAAAAVTRFQKET